MSLSAESNGQENKSATRTPAGALPTAEQLTASRAERWHQDEKPLLSLEALREWVGRGGLVVYGPRAQQLGAPSPSLVEATAGRAGETEAGSGDVARTLLARMIAEGSAVPLNLLGAAGGLGTDVPDFVASAAVFSYVFTLRGNKAWKQAPATAGAVKVSPLALAVYEMLAAKVTMSSYDLATQLGKEVTEGAVLRALTELWGQLRVLPVPQLDGTATLWELTTARFTKQMKAGANAGQPSALSALISLYLGQAVAATEDEIETFLSPLAARSRVRDVVHALMSARQLETIVVEGKTLLHVAGDLPGFAAVEAAEVDTAAAASGEAETEGAGSRISKFAGKPRSKIGTGLRSKPAFAKKAGFGAKPSLGARPAAGGDRERRPFRKDDRDGAAKPRFEKPAFDKPWSEDRKPREGSGESFAATAGEGGEARPVRREFTPRPRSAEGGDGPKKTFSKPGTFGRKREGFAGKPGFDRGEGRPPRREYSAGEGRPPRREAGERSERPAGGGFKRTGGAAGSYTPRPKPAFGGKPSFGAKPYAGKPSFGQDRGGASEGGEAPRKVYRKFDAPRDKKPFGSKPSFGAKPFGAKPAGPRTFGDKPVGDRPARSFDGPRSFDRPRSEGGERSERPRASFGAKPGGFAGKSGAGGGKKPFAKAGGPFAKFAEGKKPFRKPGPGKKTSSGGRSEGGSGGGFGPVKRRRPEGNS